MYDFDIETAKDIENLVVEIAIDHHRFARVQILRGMALKALANKEFVTYGVAAKALRTFGGSQILSKALCDLMYINVRNSEPVMSALFVGESEESLGEPGDGFFGALEEIFGVSQKPDRELWWSLVRKARSWFEKLDDVSGKIL